MKTIFFVYFLLLFSGKVWPCALPRGPNDTNYSFLSRDLTTNCGEEDIPPPNRVDTTERLAALRPLMTSSNLGAYIIPQDEEGRRPWISGFSGSQGTSIVTATEAATWTDGRYFLQASQELDCNWELMRDGQPGVPSVNEWLKRLPSGSRVGADPNLIGAQTWLDMEQDLSESNIVMVSMRENLIDDIWTTANGRPEFTPKDVVIHGLEFAGIGFEDKVLNLREKLVDDKIDAMVVTEMDEIAWLLNLRGEGTSSVGGLKNSPVFQSQVLLTDNGIQLWMHLDKVTAELQAYFQPSYCGLIKTCITVSSYANALVDLETWAHGQPEGTKVLITEPSMYAMGASYAVYEAIPASMAVFAESPVMVTKVQKNPTEVSGMINAHIKDAHALIGFLAFLENDIVNQGVTVWDEIEAAGRLLEYRQNEEHFKGTSFQTISASGSNGAVIHYRPDAITVASINDSSVYLLDSGGQYLDGTTDVTRTMHYGTPSEEVIEMYTRVLMGAIDLARAVFPDGTSDRRIDYASRQHLYNIGHGTGHGIGAYLNIHEGPTRIGIAYPGDSPLRENMFFSDEPGFYKDGEYGIRLETIVRVVKKDLNDGTYGDFLGLEPVTLVPFEPKLINFSMMSPVQIIWFNEYNQKILDIIRPLFDSSEDSLVLNWIDDKTEYVDPNTGRN